MKVLLVEDDQFHAGYLSEALQLALPDVEDIFHATNGLEGEQLARRHSIQSVVMDLQMKERNGIDAARTIWRERPQTRILFWSNYSDEAYLRGIARIVPQETSYRYVLKTATQERLHLALRGVFLESQIVVDQEIHRAGVVGKNAAHLRRRHDDCVRPGLGHPVADLGLLREIHNIAPGGDDLAVFAV